MLRVPAAVLAASPYLAAAYLAQGAFKEPLLGLAVLGFALALPPLRAVWSGRTSRSTPLSEHSGTFAIPLGVIAAGTIYNYSFPGLAWLVGTAVIWMLVIALRERDRTASVLAGLRLRERFRGARPALLLGIGIPVIAALPEVFRLASFSSFKAFNPSGTGPTVGFGNLRQQLNPLEAFGIWPSGEFRITPANSTTPEIAFYLGGLLALAAFAWATGAGALAAGVRSALGSDRLGALLPGRARRRHSVHAGQGPRHRRAAGHADHAPGAGLGGRDRGRGVGGPRGWCGPVAARHAPAVPAGRRTAAHGGLRGRGSVLDPVAAPPGGGRTGLPPPGNAPDASRSWMARTCSSSAGTTSCPGS